MIPRLTHLRRTLTLLAVCSVLALTAGCVVVGPSRDSPDRTDPERTDRAPDEGNEVTAEKNLDILRKSINSYAIVDAERDPRLNIHLFGLPGAHSLSTATETALLKTIRSAGGFGSHQAFSPVATPPSHRWEPTAFDRTTSATSNDDGDGDGDGDGSAGAADVNVSNNIIAAGGRFLISALTRQSPTTKTWAVLTDLANDTTVHAQEMFTSEIDPAEVAADEFGELTIDGEPVAPSDLTPQGTSVAEALHTPLALPEGADVRDPDYSCALLPCVALTYDDGPGEPDVEDRLLMEAESAQVRLTYFLVGRRVAADPGTVKRISAAGHEVANHTYSHPRLNRTDSDTVKAEVKRTDKTLETAVSKAQPLVRPPFGALDKSAASALDRPAILWDVDTGDWKHKDSDRTITAVRDNAEPGSIVLMHSIHPTTVNAAPGVFRTVADDGLYPVTVSQLFEGIGFEKGGSYFCRGYGDELCSTPEHPSVHKD